MTWLVKLLGPANGKWVLTNLFQSTQRKPSILGRQHLMAITDPKGSAPHALKQRLKIEVK